MSDDDEPSDSKEFQITHLHVKNVSQSSPGITITAISVLHEVSSFSEVHGNQIKLEKNHDLLNCLIGVTKCEQPLYSAQRLF